MAGRLAKIAICLAVGLFAAIVTFDNIWDYETNFAFVRHVMSMDTTHADNALMGRAITNPTLWRAAYALIVVGEGLTSALFLAGSAALLLRLRAPAAAFQQAKGWIHGAGASGFLVWFFGFTVVGGEWFQMWQSAQWNGQQPAFRIVIILLAVMIYVDRSDTEPSQN